MTLLPLPHGATRTIEITVAERGGVSSYVQGWIDWDGDGEFSASEQAALDVTLAVGSVIAVPVTVPVTAMTGRSR